MLASAAHAARSLVIAGLLLLLLGGIVPAPEVLQAANDDVGYVDFAVGSASGGDLTADKPQSKLWHHDGAWWAVMLHPTLNRWRIYRLAWPDSWVDTGTEVDDRANARADVLWNGSALYVVSSVRGSSSNQGRLYRYSYDAAVRAFRADSGFPVTVMTGATETLTLDQDSTGRLWIAFTQNRRVYVAHSTDDDRTWVAPFVLPGTAQIGSDDIAALVAYRDGADGPSIGVVWSNQVLAAMQFARHRDADAASDWSPVESIYVQSCAADDHINLKSLQADPSGTLFAALKTSFNDSGCGGAPTSPLIRLVVRRPDNSWRIATFGTVADNHTRPLVLLDTSNRRVYMFATAPVTGGVIYMKSSPMDNPSFPSGLGTPFISSSIYTTINNATSTKQTVNVCTGLVVLASDQNKRRYLHNVLSLGSCPTPTPPPSPSPSPTPPPSPSPTSTPTSPPSPSPQRVFLPSVQR